MESIMKNSKRFLGYVLMTLIFGVVGYTADEDQRGSKRQGNLSSVQAGGDIRQNFHEGGQGGHGGSVTAVFNSPREKKQPQDYFDEGRVFKDKGNYKEAERCFLQASGCAETELKIDALNSRADSLLRINTIYPK